MRNIMLMKINDKEFIFLSRGVNNFLFTDKELGDARKRYEDNKDVVDRIRRQESIRW